MVPVIKVKRLITNRSKKEVLLSALMLIFLLISVLANYMTDYDYSGVVPIIHQLLIICFMIGVYIGYKSIIKLHSETENNIIKQVNSMVGIYNVVNPLLPLPNTRKWAMSPDLLSVIVKIILTNKPQHILEISSGVSSLVIGYSLKLNGGGKCISIENNEKIAQQLKKSVEACGLKDFVDIRYAPLKTYTINDTEYLWYNIFEIDDVLNIDLMIVDGPYKGIQQYARLPAAYLMDSRMSEHCSIIMDDMSRDEEQEIVRMWEKDLDLKVEEYYECEKGACSLIKVKK